VWAQAALENPQNGSVQSGIGIVSGWKCSVGRIDLVFDNAATVQASYGTSRLDTRPACGDDNNGFGYLINWNDLGDGQHTVVAKADGVEFARATFTVKTLGHSFLSGLSGQTKVVNFGNQINVTVRWQESAQSFVIVDSTAPLRLSPPTGIDLGPSVPLCEQPDGSRLTDAGSIDAFARSSGFLRRPVALCAVSLDNPRYFITAGNALSGNTNPGVIFYDVTFLNRFNGISDFADDVVLAHEWGHQAQFDNPSRIAGLSDRQLELQADCFSGIYFGHLVAVNPDIMEGDVTGIITAICGIGVGENLSWASIASHGTCEERAVFFARGISAQLNAEVNRQPYDPFLVCR
jgi:hypothetical protein